MMPSGVINTTHVCVVNGALCVYVVMVLAVLWCSHADERAGVGAVLLLLLPPPPPLRCCGVICSFARMRLTMLGWVVHVGTTNTMLQDVHNMLE